MPYVFIFFGMLILALVQGRLGFLGIEYHFGAGWAWAAIVASVLFRSFLPITVGAYFGAVDVMRWDWYIGVAVAFPGLFFVLPSMVVATLSAFSSGNSKNNGNDQSLIQTKDENPSTETGLNSVYQAPALKPRPQAPGGANRKVTNVEQRDEIEDYPRAAIAIKYRAEIAPDWSKVRSLPSELRRMYLEKLDDNPDIDARELYAMVDERLKQDAAPFADDQTNKMYASLAQYGSEAQKRFRDIHDVLGVSFNAERVANEISKDYSIEKFLEHINPGRYRTEKNLQFEKLPKGELMLLSINGHSQGTKPFSVSNFLIRYAEYSEDLRSSFLVDIMHIKKADGKLVEVTTDTNRFWVSSYLGEKQFDTITEVFDFLGTPLGYRKV